MAAIRFLLLSAVVLLLSAVTFTEGMRYGSGPKTCCFDFVRKPVNIKMVKSYEFTSQQCSKNAVLFTMRWGRQVCAKPTDPWVTKFIKTLEASSNPAKMSGSQGSL